jgi:hypothetical protein
LGEGLMAGAAWQCVAGADALNMGVTENAFISVAGFHQHAIGAQFCKSLREPKEDVESPTRAEPASEL